MKKKVILDFDGTLTETHKEAEPFFVRFAALLAERAGVPALELFALLAAKREEIGGDPHRGWEINGKIAAPAIADPYVLNSVACKELMTESAGLLGALPRSPDAQDELLVSLFHEAYPFAGTVFKLGAKDFLAELGEVCDIIIVTNSRTESVQNKLTKIGCTSIPVVGNAKKYFIGDAWSEVPEALNLPDYPRPILLRRPYYNDVLQSLAVQGFTPDTTTVIGDIFEIDLALPAHLGYATILFASENDVVHQGLDLGDTAISRSFSDVWWAMGVEP